MANGQPDVLLSKADVDRVFSFNKKQWSEAAGQMMSPIWNVRVHEHDSGAEIIGFDPDSGIGLSVMPFFRDDSRPPDMVIVGNYFPFGTLPPMTDVLKREMEIVASKEIGAAYSLTVKYEVTDKFQVIEFLITEL